jgi:thiol-disulfide isomerase/thioredoxin
VNTEPLTMQQLRGKVVLIDFWTYSCINCIRTFPYLKDWDAKYKDKGLVIVGVHTPEFEFEKNPDNVKDAVKRFELPYPIAIDSDFKTWLNFNNRYWPAHYLIDQEGIIRGFQFGEGVI